MDCVKKYGVRYVFAYIIIAELYVAWFMTIGFSDYYSILILLANLVVLCIILNDNVPYLPLAIRKNWQRYMSIMYWFYGHNAMVYTYEYIRWSAHHIQDSASNQEILPISDLVYMAGLEYIEQLLYSEVLYFA